METMTTEMIMMKLAAIRGKNNGPQANGDTQPASTSPESHHLDAEEQEEVDTSKDSSAGDVEESVYDVSDVVEASTAHSKELIELAMKWGAEIGLSGILINNSIQMSKKDYLKYIKNLSREALLKDPLLYILFRSEEQGDANFFHWIERFQKAENEN
jgi:hypothetical protein